MIGMLHIMGRQLYALIKDAIELALELPQAAARRQPQQHAFIGGCLAREQPK
jgi:hypothetical protein